MVLEFTSVPGASACVEFPLGWVGTTTSVRVSSHSERATFSLGLRPWSGRAAHGIFQPSETIALVVDKGTGHWFKEAVDGALWVAPARLWPILEVVEAPSCLALVSGQEIELLSGDALFRIPVLALDGFRGVVLAADRISGAAWANGEWRDFSFDIAGVAADLSARHDIAWESPVGSRERAV